MTLRVLVVDDSAGYRRAARALLELGGDVVVGEAADGAEAARLVPVLRPDLVLLDVRLPDVSGFELATRLAPHCPIVLVSSHTWPDIGARVQDCGAVGFLPKEALTVSSLHLLMEAA